ncbi:nucleoside-diphosphate-sugar epimerase [Klebsiella pneumoniae]|uniref:Nucleoside-diphosphate-sugar epimerase n=1 Tax=Klebsiella pneumoniae TaxID=573 RepID=A0A2X3CUJ0_KLEPN|nr:nucleoside-diphosphate-sugar epimerase [Klebsiella pneumoniae]
MLKAMRLYGAFATLNVRFSNDKLLSMGMPKTAALYRLHRPLRGNHPRIVDPSANGRRL